MKNKRFYIDVNMRGNESIIDTKSITDGYIYNVQISPDLLGLSECGCNVKVFNIHGLLKVLNDFDNKIDLLLNLLAKCNERLSKLEK